jgi:hypothetical protein
VDKLLKQHMISDDEICLINTVHDSIAYEVADHLVDWFAAALKTIAERAIPELGGNSFKFDVGVGQNWAAAEMA